MKTSLDKSKSTRHRLTVEVSKERVVKAVKQALGKIQKQTQIKGFRKGEVPFDVLRNYLGQDADKEIIKEIIGDTYPEALRKEAAAPISEPHLEYEQYVEGEPFTYHAVYDVMPEIEAPEYEDLKLEKEKIEVAKEEVESGLERLRHSMTQLEPYEKGEFGPGTIAVLDFKGTADGKPFKGSEAKDFMAEFGHMLPDFENQIKGMKAGEEKEIIFSYPKDYFNKDIAGKEAKFKVKVNKIQKKVVPELDDEFAKSLGKFEKIDQVREEIKKQITDYKENFAKQQLAGQALQLIVDKNQIEVPEVMVNDELRAMLDDVARQLKSQGQTLKDAGVEAKSFVEKHYNNAANRVRGYLLTFAIAKKENLSVSDQEVEARINGISKQTGQPLNKVKEHFEKNNLLDKLKSQILYEKTLELIMSKAKVKEVKPKKAEPAKKEKEK
ncbi:MAG: trigger factor [Pseudomonadota bacterium]